MNNPPIPPEANLGGEYPDTDDLHCNITTPSIDEDGEHFFIQPLGFQWRGLFGSRRDNLIKEIPY